MATANAAGSGGSPPSFAVGENNVAGVMRNPKGNPPGVLLAGVFKAASGCESAAKANAGATSWTYHHCDFPIAASGNYSCHCCESYILQLFASAGRQVNYLCTEELCRVPTFCAEWGGWEMLTGTQPPFRIAAHFLNLLPVQSMRWQTPGQTASGPRLPRGRSTLGSSGRTRRRRRRHRSSAAAAQIASSTASATPRPGEWGFSDRCPRRPCNVGRPCQAGCVL